MNRKTSKKLRKRAVEIETAKRKRGDISHGNRYRYLELKKEYKRIRSGGAPIIEDKGVAYLEDIDKKPMLLRPKTKAHKAIKGMSMGEPDLLKELEKTTGIKPPKGTGLISEREAFNENYAPEKGILWNIRNAKK